MRSPSFALYVRDILASKMLRRVHQKYPSPFGMYFYMLCEAWLEDPPATLPNENGELAIAGHVTDEQFEEYWPLIQHQFESDGNGRIFNPKQLEIHAKQKQSFENRGKGGTARAQNLTPKQRSAIAKKGANKRWKKK